MRWVKEPGHFYQSCALVVHLPVSMSQHHTTPIAFDAEG